MENKRSQFSGKVGFVLAAAGSAVGLGNIWRFPYYAAKYGGGAFILVYIILVVTFGFTLMMTEIALGRKTGKSAIGAYKAINKKSSFIGVFSVIVAAIIIPYYSVIGGWVIKYFTVFLSGGIDKTVEEGFFSGFISSNSEPIMWQALFIIMGIAVILGGVKGGIEKASKILMPILLILTIFLAFYSFTLPNALDGFKYLFVPDFTRFKPIGAVAAMGQMFYSMSLSMAVMITYGSYMRKDEDIEKCVGHIELFDTGIAILSAMMIVPAVFSFSNGDPAALNAGPGLMFITMPKVFSSMPMGGLIGAIFFALVFFAALTSIISLMEAVLSVICDKFKISRKVSAMIVCVFCIVVGIAPSLGFGAWSNIQLFGLSILDMMDFLTNYILMPLGACFTCILIGFIVKPDFIIQEVTSSGKFKRQKLYVFILKYIAPVFTIAILVVYCLDTFKVVKL